MAVNLKLGVELGDFQQNINQAKAQIKEFDAALKSAESRFKATGDAESAMATKTSQLTAKLQAQKKMVDEYRAALQKADEGGVSKLNAEYIKLQTQMLNAEAAMYDTQTALNALSMSEKTAADGADALTKSVSNIGKKISLDQVINGIGRITDGMERAAQHAVTFAKNLWDGVMDSAQRADDIATASVMYDIPLQRYKQMLALEASGLDTSTNAILSAQKKLGKGIGGDNKNAVQALKDLGVSLKKIEDTGNGILEFVDKDPAEAFFDIGRALYDMEKGYDKEAAAQALFGRSWEELMPLFKDYKTLDEYNAALDKMNVTTDQATENSVKMNDSFSELKNTMTTIQDEIVGQLAPGLTDAANALNDMLTAILEYLQSENGQEMLGKLGESVAGLFDDLSKVNPEDVVSNFVTVFDKLTEGLKYLADNWGSIVEGIKEIGIAFGLLKISEGVLTFLKLIGGAKSLLGSGSGTGIGGGGGGLLGGIGGKLLASGAGVGLTTATAAIGSALTMFDATGSAALIGPVAEDQFALFRTLRNGGSLEDAVKDAGKEVEASFNNAVKAWTDWGNDLVELPKKLAESVWKDLFGGGNKGDWSGENGDDWSAQVKIEPKTDEEAAAEIAAQIGTVSVPVKLLIQGGNGSSGPSYGGAAGGGGGLADYYMDTLFGSFRPGYANGIRYVPDTRLAWLHPGETVTPAREISSRNFSSNLYVEKMVMNNGTDAAGLAAAMAAAQRATMNGYGS